MYVPDDYKEPKGPTAAESRAMETQAVIDEFKKDAQHVRESGTRIKESEWRTIDTLWESGEATLREIARKFNTTTATLAVHFKKNGIKKGARAEDLRQAVRKQQEIEAQTEAAVISERIRQTKEDHYKMATALAKITFGEVIKMRSTETPYGKGEKDIKTLLLAAEALKKCREERWVTLGLDKDAVDESALPELTLHTLTAKEVQQIRDNQAEDDDEMGIEDEIVNV